MEKLVYLFWLDTGDRPAAALQAALADQPADLRLQLNLPDPAFRGGQPPLRNLLPRFDGMVSAWLPSRRDRSELEALLAAHAAGYHGYAVCESVPMAATLPAADDNGRIDALSQVCLLRRPETMTIDSWLDTWLYSHSDIAMRTQGTVAYIQNIVQAPVTSGAPAVDGIVEECYPPRAYTDLETFFGAPGDPAGMKANIDELLASTARFLPEGGVDRIFTARYTAGANAA